MLKQGRTKVATLMGQRIRCVWGYEAEVWYYAAIDIFGVLTGSVNPTRHWSDLKRSLKMRKSDLSREFYDAIVKLKLESKSGQKRYTDVLSASDLSGFFDFIPRNMVASFRQWVGAKKCGAKDKALHRQLWK